MSLLTRIKDQLINKMNLTLLKLCKTNLIQKKQPIAFYKRAWLQRANWLWSYEHELKWRIPNKFSEGSWKEAIFWLPDDENNEIKLK